MPRFCLPLCNCAAALKIAVRTMKLVIHQAVLFCLQTYRVITIPTPDPLERPSLSTAGSHSSAGRSSATASHNNTGGSASTLEQLREEGQGGTMLSDRASAFAAASAAAQQQPGLRQQPGQPRQQQQDQEPRAGSAPVQSAAAPERSASGRFAGTSDGYRKRTMSVRVDLEAAIDEERYMAGEQLGVCKETYLIKTRTLLPHVRLQVHNVVKVTSCGTALQAKWRRWQKHGCSWSTVTGGQTACCV